MKIFFDTPRFMDVPFYIRAGKSMEKDLVEMKIVFKLNRYSINLKCFI